MSYKQRVLVSGVYACKNIVPLEINMVPVYLIVV